MSQEAHREREESLQLQLDFGKLRKVCETDEDLIVGVAQDRETGAVLITGFVNREALKEALHRKLAVFYSTSRRELWIKGATSGDYLDLVEARVNCEQNSILYIVHPRKGGACHTKDENGKARTGCYYRAMESETTLRFVDPSTRP